jgi:hypothetical protein
MAYYLGRDLDFALTTENTLLGLQGANTSGSSGEREMVVKDWSAGGDGDYVTADSAKVFAGPKLQTGSPVTVFGGMSATVNSVTSTTWNNRPTNITGLDLSVSTQDEDVQFIGQRNVLKAEVKKENSITITRKKKDDIWNLAFDQSRFGISEAGGVSLGGTQPDFTSYGYRIYMKFNTSSTTGETFILPNCCITEYSVTMSPDASQEENMTFISYVNPILLTGLDGAGQIDNSTGGL